MRNLSIPPFTYIIPLACPWKSMIRIENTLPYSNVYHINVAESHLAEHQTKPTTKTHKKQTPFVCENMDDLREYSKFLEVFIQKLFPEQLTLSHLEWSSSSFKRLTYISMPLSLTMLKNKKLRVYLGK